MWSFVPDASFPPKTYVSKAGTVTVKYTITNNSTKAHTLVLKPQLGISQQSLCRIGPKGSMNSSCLLTLTISGNKLPSGGLFGGPALCQVDSNGNPSPSLCYQPGPADSLAITSIQHAPILSMGTVNLALSVKGLTLNGLSSGQARTITITNIGDAPATGLSVHYPAWPGGTPATHASDNCRSTLASGASCVISIVPGATATSGLGNIPCTTGIAPIPGVISVAASNANQVAANVVILGYGCIYQGGFVYAMTETVNRAQSIGGAVTSLNDQVTRYPNGIIWSSNGGTGNGNGGTDSIDVSYDLLPGIDDSSTSSSSSPTYADFSNFFAAVYTNTNPFVSSSFSACQGKSAGQCNVSNILKFYNTLTTNYNALGTPHFTAAMSPTPLTYYASGLCSDYTIDSSGNSPCLTGTCYGNWYLPSICEMGPASNASGCLAGTQNIINSFPALIGDPASGNPATSCTLGTNCLAGAYWSSTEYSPICPQGNAWYQYFAHGSSSQYGLDKSNQAGVRCSRALT